MVAKAKERKAFTLIELLVVVAIIGVLVSLLLAAVQSVRAAAARTDCQNRVRQLALGLHQYHDARHTLPPGLRTRDDPHLYMSWLARLLPYLEQQSLWEQADRQFKAQPQFWNPPGGHEAVAAREVKAFNCPSGDRSSGTVKYLMFNDAEYSWGFTWYLGVSGGYERRNDGVLYANSKVRLGEITDGSSNTVMVGERPPSPDNHWGWWYAGLGQNGTGSADSLLPAVGYPISDFRLPTCERAGHPFGQGRRDEICDILHFWSLHPGGGNFAFADGSVRFLRYSAASVLPALATRAGGESVSVD
jgi:prepilin-type N-terminal cleavage/methylation domain-containing protein/prepilin-type processing-associated H-X9-DG protein